MIKFTKPWKVGPLGVGWREADCDECICRETGQKYPPGKFHPRQRTNFRSIAERDAFMEDIRNGIADTATHSRGAMRFKDVVEEWLGTRVRMAESTKDSYRSAIGKHGGLAPIADWPVAIVAREPAKVSAIMQAARKPNGEPLASHSRFLNVIKGACKYALANDWITGKDYHGNVCSIEIMDDPEPRRLVRATEQQLDRIAEAMGKHQMVLWCCVALGARMAEILGLRASDFSPEVHRGEPGTVCIQRQAYKGDVKRKLKSQRAPKSRTVPVPDWLAAMLIDPVQWHNGRNLAACEGGALFPGGRYRYKPDSTYKHREFVHYNTVFKPFKKAAIANGPYTYADGSRADASKLIPHQFRHEFATSMKDEGARQEVVAAVMGDTERTVADTYFHMTAKGMDEARAALERRWQRP